MLAVIINHPLSTITKALKAMHGSTYAVLEWVGVGHAALRLRGVRGASIG